MLSIPIRDPDKGYLDTWLWLPKREINETILKNSLSLFDANMNPIRAFRDSANHLGVPREKIDLEKIDYDVVDLTPANYESVNIKSKIILDPSQKLAFEDMKNARGGILELACGKGKTIEALHLIAELKVPTLIVNNYSHILEQWRAEIKSFLEVDDTIGWVQGNPNKWDWKHSITLASLKSLAMYSHLVPPEMARYFGLVIYDEVHRISTKLFSKTAPVFFGKRFGLTATVKRDDGMEVLYLWHLGKVLHTNLEQDIIPKVIFIKSPTEFDFDDIKVRENVCTIKGEFHFGKACNYLSTIKEENDLVSTIISGGIELNRDMLVLSLSRGRTQKMHELFPNSGLIDGGVPYKNRLKILAENKLIFGTIQIAKEALNKKSLDSLIILTEFSSQNNLQQTIGRTQRKLGGKPIPRIIIIWHKNIIPLYRAGKKLMRHFQGWNMEVAVKG
jgi:superfamily II DNA or RNA helicase